MSAALGQGTQSSLKRPVEVHRRRNGLDQHRHIEPRRPVARVVEIAGDARGVAQAVAPAPATGPSAPAPQWEMRATSPG